MFFKNVFLFLDYCFRDMHFSDLWNTPVVWITEVPSYIAMHTALQMCKKLLCLNPVATENVGKKSKMSHNAHPNNQSHSEVRWPFRFICSYAPLITQRY